MYKQQTNNMTSPTYFNYNNQVIKLFDFGIMNSNPLIYTI